MATQWLKCQNETCRAFDVEIEAPEVVTLGSGLAFRPGSFVCTSCGWDLPRCEPRPIDVNLTLREAQLLTAALQLAIDVSQDPTVKATQQMTHDRVVRALSKVL